jgi:nitrate reductase NapE component
MSGLTSAATRFNNKSADGGAGFGSTTGTDGNTVEDRRDMEFTPQETKLIQRLRKQERQWVWARWLFLVMGIWCIILCALLGYLLYQIVSESGSNPIESANVFIIALIWTKCCMYFCFAIWFFITAAVKWHGDANRMLLLRLLDVQQKQSVKDTHVTQE